MPPPAVKTVEDLIFWQYAKIIAESAGFGKKNWGFVMRKFKQLQEREIFWNEIREYVKEREKSDECIFCGRKGGLTLEHLFPRCHGGPDDEKNVVFICRECNSAKGERRPYEFWTMKYGLESAKYDMPRIAEGKYLKFAYEVLRSKELLKIDKKRLRAEICPKCDLRKLCEKEGSAGEFSPLCLDGILSLCAREAIK